ncbi:ABC transporter permease [uncultured Azohydromonas sp.]|jgi:ABC-type multidrug transport system, permease component|uniref:ABC transporter permease n=1 Tax=uncultured Azohydromonas sp. TaxID=487342 RepID=UPI002629A812|nr:ABC transporter permease [uncultured Azohydromonas sp.]
MSEGRPGMRGDGGRDGGFWRRLRSLVRKEFRQLLRDRSNLLVGLGLPIVLILIFGYGLTLDVRNARLVLALDDASPAALEVVAALDGSPYMATTRALSLPQALSALEAHQTDALVHVPADFSRRLAAGDARLHLLLQGGDPIRAAAVQGYVEGAVAVWAQKRLDRAGLRAGGAGVVVVDRMWFNAANNSTWYLVPGLIVLIMTLVGTFLTALVMAREWERGTLEALFVSPVRPVEVLLAKIVTYFVVGMVGLALCLVAARGLFGVPLYGSLAVLLAASMLYMVVSLGIGLLISAFTRNQFLASQIAILASFMPALMLSGFVFDLRNVPLAVRVVGHVLPATYFMELVKTLFLAGDQWGLILKDGAILAAYAVGLLGLARAVTRKRLD